MTKYHWLSAAALCALAMPALAQPAPAETASESDPDVIVVTGQKQTRTLQETPTSVGVMTSDDITTRNLISVYDALAQTANVAVPANKQGFSIRGIDAFNVSGAGEGALASVYLDGAPMPQRALLAGPLDLFDIAQIEVYRGPQSTLQGRNALAGAVIIRTTDPTFDWSGKARVQMTDSDGGRRYAAALGGPLIADQLAFRLSGEVARADGLIDNVSLGEKEALRASETIRAKLLFMPTALPGLKIVGSYLHDRHLRGGDYFAIEAPAWPDERLAYNNVPNVTTTKSDIATLDASYAIGRHFTLSSVTSYSEVGYYYSYDSDWGATSVGSGYNFEPATTLTQEVRLNFDFGTLKGLVGGYYSNEDKKGSISGATQRIAFVSIGLDRMLTAPPPAGYGLPTATANYVMDLYPGRGVDIFSQFITPRKTTNKALFGDATWEFVPDLKLNLGFRWDHENQDRAVDQIVTVQTTLPSPTSVPTALQPLITGLNAQIQALASAANNSEPDKRSKFSAFLPKAGLTWQIAPDVAISGTVQRGYRSGGSGTNIQRAQYYTFGPEYTWNYELALRTEWFDRKLTLNANFFRIDWTDQQVTVQLTPGNVYDTQTINAGSSRLWGVEIEARGRPTRTLLLSAGLGYTRTKFTDFSFSTGTASYTAAGNEFADAPRWTANGSITWTSDSGLLANLNASYRSAAFQSAQTQPVRDIDAAPVVNGRFGWQGEHFGAFVFASNILNERYTQAQFALGGHRLGIVGDPRTIGLSLEAQF